MENEKAGKVKTLLSLWENLTQEGIIVKGESFGSKEENMDIEELNQSTNEARVTHETDMSAVNTGMDSTGKVKSDVDSTNAIQDIDSPEIIPTESLPEDIGHTPCICDVSYREPIEFPYDWNQLRSEQILYDGELISSDANLFRVHKAILAAVSPFFLKVFTTSLSEVSGDIKRVSVPFNSDILEKVVNYAYTGKCKIKAEDVAQLINAGVMFGIPGLVEKCREFILGYLTVNNCFSIFDISKCDVDLQQEVFQYICKNFGDIVKHSDEYKDISDNILSYFLTNDHLNVEEIDVFNAVIKWYEFDPEIRKKYVSQLFLCPRYRLMDEPTLNSVKENPLLIELKFSPHSADNYKRRIPYDIVFALGGWKNRRPCYYIETYDPRAKKWFVSRGNLPIQNAYFGVCVIENIIYIVGGCSMVKNFKSLYSLDPNVDNWEWRELACMYEERCYVCVCELAGKIYAIGGFNADDKLSSAERYDRIRNQWEMLPSMHKKRSDASATVLNNKIYVAGGYNGQAILKSAEMFDPETETWTLIEQTMMYPRAGLSLAALNGRLYALGGFDGSIRSRTVECFDPENKESIWVPVQTMGTARSNFGCTVLEGNIYVMGGFNGLRTISEVEKYNPETNEWSKVRSMNLRRSAFSVCVVSGLPNRKKYSWQGKCMKPDEIRQIQQF